MIVYEKVQPLYQPFDLLKRQNLYCLGVCICTFVLLHVRCTCVLACMWVHMCVQVILACQGQWLHWAYSLTNFCLLHWCGISHLNPKLPHLDNLASHLALRIPCLCIPCAGIMCRQPHLPGTYMGAGLLNADFHICEISPLYIKSSHQSQVCISFFFKGILLHRSLCLPWKNYKVF